MLLVVATLMTLLIECATIGAFHNTPTPAHQFTFVSVRCTVWVWLACSLQLLVLLEAALRVVAAPLGLTRRRRLCVEPPPPLKEAPHAWSPEDWQWDNTSMRASLTCENVSVSHAPAEHGSAQRGRSRDATVGSGGARECSVPGCSTSMSEQPRFYRRICVCNLHVMVRPLRRQGTPPVSKHRCGLESSFLY
jgi:hypothetical protein